MALIEINVNRMDGEHRSTWSIKVTPDENSDSDFGRHEVDDIKSFKAVLQWLSTWMYNKPIDLA